MGASYFSSMNKKKVESNAVDTLLDEGMKVKVGQFTFVVKQSKLGTLLHVSKLFLQISIDEDKIQDSVYAGTYMQVPENAERVAKVVATTILNSRMKIWLFSKLLSKYLLWSLTPSRLFSLMSVILILNNAASFTNSIRLMHTFRMMKPKEDLVEA